jgi:hypothetical protein
MSRRRIGQFLFQTSLALHADDSVLRDRGYSYSGRTTAAGVEHRMSVSF